MVHTGLADAQHFRQFLQGSIRIIQPCFRRRPHLGRQILELPGCLQAADDIQLTAGSIHSLLQISGFTVHQTIDLLPDFFYIAGYFKTFHSLVSLHHPQKVNHRIALFEDDFPSLKTMSQAGGKLSTELQAYYARYASENGKRFVIMYGQSEATAAISFLPPEDALRKPGSVGRVVPGGSVRLTDGQGRTVEGVHVRGELVYQGPNVAMGYAAGGEDLCRGDEWNGVLRTGDIAELDEDGYLTITGRLKRYIKLAGHRTSLDEVDTLVMDELNILSASVGKDDHLTVFVTNEADAAPVRDLLSKKLSAARAGLRVLTIPAFPQNEGGKILYAELQAVAEKE